MDQAKNNCVPTTTYSLFIVYAAPEYSLYRHWIYANTTVLYYFHRRSRKKQYEPAAKNSGLSTVYTKHSDASDGGVAIISKDLGQCVCN